jgi:hypothetical protein
MSFGLAMLAASCVLVWSKLLAAHAASFSARLPLGGQRPRRRSPSAEWGRRALRKGACKLSRDIPSVCGRGLSCSYYGPRNRTQQLGSWPLFFSRAGVLSGLRIWRSLAPFARLEHSVRRNCPSFTGIGLARSVASACRSTHGDLCTPPVAVLPHRTQASDFRH